MIHVKDRNRPDPSEATIGELGSERTAAGKPPAAATVADAAPPLAGPATSRGKVRKLAIARRLTAAAFLLAWVVVAWVSYQTPYLHSCSEQVVRVGSSPLVRSCDPLSLLDAPMLVLLVAAVLLLVPDMSAIEVPGILRLERQVAEQSRRQDELSRMFQDLKLDIRSHQNIDFKPIIVTANEAAETATALQRLMYGKSDKDRVFARAEELLADGPPERDDQSDAADTP